MPGEASGDARPASRGSFLGSFNFVLSSDHRVFVLKRTAFLRARSRADPSRDDSLFFALGSWRATGKDLDPWSVFKTRSRSVAYRDD